MENIDTNEGWGENDLSIQERLKMIREKFSNDEEDLLDDALFSRKTGIRYNVVNNWGKAKRTIAQKTRSKINNALGLKPEVWTANYSSYAVQIFFNELDTFRVISDNKSKEEKVKNTEKLDSYVLGKMVSMSVQEEDELEFYAQDKTIDLPGNLIKYSLGFMFNLAQQLKAKGQADDALYVLELLQQSSQNFKYTYRKKIEHLKAILLSEKSIKKWDEAIEILRYLYADSYHLEQPEIVTLTASNYKRKALYHPNGKLNHVDYVDTEALGSALSLYYEAYSLKTKNEKYYDAINIAYIERLLDILESDEGEENVEAIIKKLFKEVYDNVTVDMKNWWEVTSQIEFYVLMGDDANAVEIYEAYDGTPTRFELETTIRQIEIYVHYSDDDVAKSFLELLKKDLEKL